jgi:hypothetical protein
MASSRCRCFHNLRKRRHSLQAIHQGFVELVKTMQEVASRWGGDYCCMAISVPAWVVEPLYVAMIG